jgi:hypothetical protein
MNNARSPYSPETFVDREADTALVEGLTRQILQGETNRPRALMFQGERGSGKSWFSLHLAHTILPAIPGVTPLLIGLCPSPEELQPAENDYFIDVSPEVSDAEAATRSILEWVARRLNTTTAQDASPSELSTWLARDIEKTFSAQALVLILDSVLEADWSFLSKLETHLLAPLALLPRVLIIMTGRGQLYSWESPYLRVDVESKQLQPFDETTIQHQFERLHISPHLSPKEIHDLGGGHPLVNLLLAQSENTPEAMDEAVRVLLSVVQPAHRSQRVRQYFEALCVLDGFREDEMTHMFTAYLGPDDGEWTTPRVREARDECIRTHLMRWENSQFIIDKSLRLILLNTLQLQKPNTKWRLLEEQACQMYTAWAEKYPKSRAYYQAKADTHTRALQSHSAEAASVSVD